MVKIEQPTSPKKTKRVIRDLLRSLGYVQVRGIGLYIHTKNGTRIVKSDGGVYVDHGRHHEEIAWSVGLLQTFIEQLPDALMHWREMVEEKNQVTGEYNRLVEMLRFATKAKITAHQIRTLENWANPT